MTGNSARTRAYKFPRRRQGPGRDHGLHPGADRRRSAPVCRVAFNTLVPGNLEVRRMPPEEEPGRARRPMAAPARSTARSRASSGSTSGTTDLHSKYSLPTLLQRTRRSRATSGRANMPTRCRSSARCSRSTPIRKAGRFTPSSSVDELGVYDDDPEGRLGYLQIDRVPRLPPGRRHRLHAKRWTREQAIECFVQRPTARASLEVTSEVDRYCSWPGQACGYKVGHIEINRQRDGAKASLGPSTTCARSTTQSCLAATSRMDVLAMNVDDLISSSRT